MDVFLDLTALLSGLAGPLDDASRLIFYREINDLLRDALDDYGASLFERMMAWAGAVSLTLLTFWITIQGYRIVTGQSRDSMIALVTESMRAVLIIGVATGMALGGSTLFDFVSYDLSNQVNRVVAGQTGDLYESIDRTLGYMQLAFGSIDALHTGDDPHLQDISDRNMLFTGIGLAGPAIVAGVMLLVYKAMMALLIGFAPLCVLCLLFKPSAPIFRNWLDYLLGTLFALSVLSVMTSLAMDLVCAVAASFWAGKLLGSNPEGITSLALQQGGLGLILTTLIVSVPPAAARFFRGLLAEFTPYSAFGQGAGRAVAQAAYAGASHAHAPEREHAPAPTHAHRVSAPVQAQADEVKSMADARSFSERYPNALVSLDGHGADGDPLPMSLRALAVTKKESLREFSSSDIKVTGASNQLTTQDAKELSEITATDLNVMDHMLRRSGNTELADKFKTMKVELNLDDWSVKYAGTQNADAYAQAYYVGNRLEFNADSVRSADTMYYRVSQIAHEMRHLMKNNNDMKAASSGTPKSPIEDDAREFSREFMKQYWRPEYEFYRK